MQSTDLNLLTALDALLAEGSVSGAARRLSVTTPAMSRTLARIRDAFGDPILVRAGRGLTPTPHALALRERVRAVVEEARSLVAAAGEQVLGTTLRTFTVRASDAFAGAFAARLAERVASDAPGVTLRFAPEGDEDVASLRDGRVDLELGVMGPLGPEIRVQTLFRERLVGVVRRGHALARGRVTPARFARERHVSVSRRGIARGPIDAELSKRGLARPVALVVAGFGEALLAVAASDLVAAVPSRLARVAGETVAIDCFPLPLPVPVLVVGQAWHPRLEADPAHRFLRACVREISR
jgi:DNA-binding transcriptional LysR family regulator